MIEINADALRSKDLGDAFERMFWACFWAIDFRIILQGFEFDLLPDFIGWMMMVSALSRILDLSSVVSRLRSYASILLVMSLFDIVQWQEGDPALGSLMFFWELVSGILLLMLIWGLGGLIIAIAAAVWDGELGSKAHLYRCLYLVMVFLPGLIPLAVWVSIDLLAITLLAAAAFTVVTWLLIMKLLMDTAKVCRRRM